MLRGTQTSFRPMHSIPTLSLDSKQELEHNSYRMQPFFKLFHIKCFADGKLSIALLKTRPNRILIQSAMHPAELRSFEALYFRSGVKLD